MGNQTMVLGDIRLEVTLQMDSEFINFVSILNIILQKLPWGDKYCKHFKTLNTNNIKLLCLRILYRGKPKKGRAREAKRMRHSSEPDSRE